MFLSLLGHGVGARLRIRDCAAAAAGGVGKCLWQPAMLHGYPTPPPASAVIAQRWFARFVRRRFVPFVSSTHTREYDEIKLGKLCARRRES